MNPHPHFKGGTPRRERPLRSGRSMPARALSPDWRLAVALCAVWLACGLPARAATPAELLAGYTAQAGSPAVAARGQKLFTSTHGRDWSCSTCHGALPTATGKHASTGKPISPLAPAFNADRFTDPAKAEKWFRRNCNDVLSRECSAAEKADLLAWLLSLAR